MSPPVIAPVIALGADHRGAALKKQLAGWLTARGYRVIDCGTKDDGEKVDALDYAVATVKQLKQAAAQVGVLVCGSGHMMAMTANRFPFVRAAICRSPQEAGYARDHNDANVLCLAADDLAVEKAEEILKSFLAAQPSAESRYQRRRARLAALDITQI